MSGNLPQVLQPLLREHRLLPEKVQEFIILFGSDDIGVTHTYCKVMTFYSDQNSEMTCERESWENSAAQLLPHFLVNFTVFSSDFLDLIFW